MKPSNPAHPYHHSYCLGRLSGVVRQACSEIEATADSLSVSNLRQSKIKLLKAIKNLRSLETEISRDDPTSTTPA